MEEGREDSGVLRVETSGRDEAVDFGLEEDAELGDGAVGVPAEVAELAAGAEVEVGQVDEGFELRVEDVAELPDFAVFGDGGEAGEDVGLGV